MKITDEILNAYIRGDATDEQRKAVIDYMTENPGEMEKIVEKMQQYYDIKPQENELFESSSDLIDRPSSSQFSCLMLGDSSNLLSYRIQPPTSDGKSFNDRLTDLLNEIDDM